MRQTKKGETSPPNGPGRRLKYEPEEMRARLVQAGIETLLEEGISHGLEAVRLDAAIHRAKVPRGSAYRIWKKTDDQTPQDVFRRAVLIDLLRSVPLATGLEVTRDAAVGVLAEHAEAVASGDREQLAAVLREVVRVAAAANFSNINNNHMWRLYRTVASASTTGAAGDPEILDAVRYGEGQILLGFGEFFGEFAELFQLRLKPGLTMNEFVICGYALSEGLSNRTTSDNLRLVDIHADEKGRPWTLLGIGFEALVERFFESKQG